MTVRGSGYPTARHQVSDEQQRVISALFDDVEAARAAITELRDIGIPPADISVISRDEDRDEGANPSGPAGVAREDVQDEARTYRASSELPNDEDLPTTTAEMTGEPVVTDYEVPPDDTLGGRERLGLSRDDDLVRREDADSNADIDIYTDFPGKPGGVNPQSPVAAEARAEATEQELMRNRTHTSDTTATGAGLGALGGLLVGLGALMIPGAGPFIAAGPLALALGGIAAGGAAGGIIGALSTIGVPDEYARQYAAAIQQGQTLVNVCTDPLARDAVERVLTAHGGQEIH